MRSIIGNRDIQFLILRWSAYWLLVMGAYIFVLKPLGISHKDNTLISSSYFIFIAAGGAYLYDLKSYFKNTQHAPRLLLLILINSLIFLSIPATLNNTFPMSQELARYLLKQEFYFPFFTLEISTVKALEIIFQQILIFSLIISLQQKVKSKAQTISLFTLAFFTIHLPLVFVFGWLAFIFILPSMLAGLVFSYCILSYKYGLLYSVICHQLFYLLIGIAMRIKSYSIYSL